MKAIPLLRSGVLLLILTATIAAGCVSPVVKRLPVYDLALSLPPVSEVRCFYADETDPTKFPLLVPYATSRRSYKSLRTWAARAIHKEAQKEAHPDVIVFTEGDQFVSGSVGTATAFPTYEGGVMALGTATPTYSTMLDAIYFRLAPVALGINWDETGMVLSITEDARSSGLIEGDRIASVDGAPVTVGANWISSPHFAALLSHKAGDAIQIEWIRPGSGRMEGMLKLQENPATHLTMPTADLTAPKHTYN